MTHILFITNQCNLACEYCYEQQERHKTKPFFVSDEEIDVLIHSINKSSDQHHCVVLFGGEPLLKPDLVQHVILSVLNNVKKDKMITFNLITNGIYFSDKENLEKWHDFIQKHNVYISYDISFDGFDDKRRVDKSGKPVVDKIIKCLNNFEELNIPYRISYTLHKANLNSFINDFIQIRERFKNCQRIILRVNFKEVVSELHMKSLEEFKQYLKQVMSVVYIYLRIPICEWVCNLCDVNCKSTTVKYVVANEEEDSEMVFNKFTKREQKLSKEER